MQKVCFLLLFCPLFGQSKIEEAGNPNLEATWLVGPGWTLSMLENDPQQYVANRYAWHRNFIENILDHTLGKNQVFLRGRGRVDKRGIGLARALSEIIVRFNPAYNDPPGVKHDLLSVGFPVGELAQIPLPEDASLQYFLDCANFEAVKQLPSEYHRASDLEIRSYLSRLREETWQAREAWATFYLARFTPEARVILVRYAGEHRAFELNQTFLPVEPTRELIERVKRKAEFNFRKYYWSRPTETEPNPAILMTPSGAYAEWVSAESVATHLFGKVDHPEPSVNKWLHQLGERIPRTMERAKGRNNPKGCDYISDMRRQAGNVSLEEMIAQSPGIFSARVSAARPGFYRNMLMFANQLLTVEVEQWLRKPEGEPGNRYFVINGHVDFPLGPYHLCSSETGYPEVPIGSRVLIFAERHPLDMGNTLIFVAPNQIHLLDEAALLTTTKDAFYGKVSRGQLKDLVAAHPFVKNKPAEVRP